MIEMEGQNNLYEGITEQKSGDVSTTTIQTVEKGKAKDLMSEEMREASQYPIADDAIVLRVETANGTETFFNFPKDGVVKPKHKLARFKATYGKYPEVGMEVKTILEANGFNSLLMQ